MPRRNNRAVTFDPLDLTPEDASAPPPNPSMTPRQAEAAREKQHRARIKRQTDARINQGIDWSVCLVPGCGAPLKGAFGARLLHSRPSWRDHSVALPLCIDHLVVAATQAQAVDPDVAIAALERLHDRKAAKVVSAREAEKKARLARTDGEMYFIRLNDLIKVGWTRDLYDRLKSYGASAELLASYPATRDDETNLHRQLTPARAKGREWYQDGPILQSFIEQVLAKHGQPRTFDTMWTQPKQVVAGKRH